MSQVTLPENNLNALEAVLFIYGEPVSFKKISQILGLSLDGIPELAEKLSDRYKESALALVVHAEQIQLVTNPKLAHLLEKVVKEELSDDLTPASVETLAIISYLGPISRFKIDFIRGVNSSFILRNLLLRGLIDRFPDPERPNAFAYSCSFDFLRHMGVGRVEELPNFERYHKLADKLQTGLGGESNAAETVVDGMAPNKENETE